jgi:hypothetical protein
MRKLFWGCAAAGLATLGLLHAGQYTMHHPDSVMCRCAIGVYHACANIVPVCQVGVVIADCTANGMVCAGEDELAELPDDPAPIEIASPCPVEPEKAPLLLVSDPNRGRLPGKIVIAEGDEPPMAIEDRLAPEPNLERCVQQIEVQWMNENGGQDVTRSFWKTPTEAVRQMPYCTDGDATAAPMPYAEQPDAAPRKRDLPKIWNPFPAKGTEVGGHEESELNPNGSDCREDPLAPLQIPGCLHPRLRQETNQVTPSGAEPSGEEPSVPSQPEKKKSKRAEPPKAKRTFDESKLLPFAAPIKLDTMEFRPSDWGINDRPMPPF